MNDVTPKSKKASQADPLDPKRQAEAAAALRAALGEAGDDEQLMLDTIEGETGLFELIDALLGRIRERTIIVEGVDAVVKALKERGARAEKGIERDRALIEQALSIAGIGTLVRPTATITLTRRPPSLTVTEESEIPARFWKTGAPTLDRKALTEALAARITALANLPDDPADRQLVLTQHPEIPGATMSNGAPSLTIRTK